MFTFTLNIKAHKMEAKVKYQNGWILEIPSIGNAPMLFLEWVSQFRSGKMPIEKVINEDCLKIRFNVPKIQIEKCAEYINSNL